MHIGAAMFFTDYSMTPARARAWRWRSAASNSLWAPEHSPHPAVAQVALPERRRPAEEVLRRDGPVRGADGGGGRHQDAQGRHRHLPDRPARSDPDRQAGRLDRPDLRRALPVRRRQRLEPGRDGEPRHRLRNPPQAGARAHRGDEGDLDQVEGRVSRRVGQLRSDDDLAQAGAEAASADHRRRRLPLRRAPRHPLRRRLDAAPRAHDTMPTCATCCPKFRKMAKEAGRDPPRADHHLGRQGGRGPAEARPRRGVARVVVSLDSAKADKILPELDRWAALAEKVA